MNRYFLIVALLQLVSEITPVNPLTTWLPLIFIFAVTAVKEAVDDVRRWRADAAANARQYTVLRRGQRGPVSVCTSVPLICVCRRCSARWICRYVPTKS